MALVIKLPTIHTRIWRLAAPMILSNLTVPLLGLVDTAVMGHLDQAYYLGAVAVGAQIFSFLFWSFNFLRMGTTGPAAQALGAGDHPETVATLLRAVLLGSAIGVVLIALQQPILWLALPIFGASAEVERLAIVFLSIRIWSAPAALAASAMVGWFVAMQNTRAVLAVQVVTNLVNVALNLLFVLGFGWDVAGVATATLIAEWSGLVLSLFLAACLARPVGGLAPGWGSARLFDRLRLMRMIAVNRDIFLRTLCTMIAFSLINVMGARYGDVALAANAVLLNFMAIMTFGLDGFAHAAETLVGAAIGARDRAALRAAVGASFVWAIGAALLIALGYAMAGPLIVDALTGLDEIRAAARSLL
ncbi:MAG: MATE family efflux transporter, partial [Alphaproteobacteria bacterium]|nr:MATE family efflux transporter [Alphaproteobacteria bacterium]